MKHFLFIVSLAITPLFLTGQIYSDSQTRHRFAQLNLGLDIQSNTLGRTRYFDPAGQIQELESGHLFTPRILIGGTHFWGHADFYISIPLYTPTLERENQVVRYTPSVETVFKYYPFRIEHGGIRPFIGISLAPFFYEQENKNFHFGNGPELSHTSVPLLTGITYNYKNHLLEARLLWNYSHKQDYYISRTEITQVTTPPLYLDFSYRYMLETTISAERDWESGRTAEITSALAQQGKLDGFFAGIGISSAFWLGNSSYNEAHRPYISSYSISLMPDFALGYYLHKPDVNMALAYRSYSTSTNTYGAVQELKRNSLGLEATKYLFDYHGFVPFIGPVISYENLAFTESFEDQPVQDVTDKRFSYGLTFGWDIRPNRLQQFILRTNLRWYPDIHLAIEDGASVTFNCIEFNFIQLILYPNRIFQ